MSAAAKLTDYSLTLCLPLCWILKHNSFLLDFLSKVFIFSKKLESLQSKDIVYTSVMTQICCVGLGTSLLCSTSQLRVISYRPWRRLSQSHLWGLGWLSVQSPCACRELELTPGSSALFWLQWVCLHRHMHEVYIGSVKSMSKVYCPQKCLVLRNKNVSGFKYGPPCSEKIAVFTACSRALVAIALLRPRCRLHLSSMLGLHSESLLYSHSVLLGPLVEKKISLLLQVVLWLPCVTQRKREHVLEERRKIIFISFF